MYTAATVNRVDELRAVSCIRKLTLEESQEVLKLVRCERVSASYASAGSKAKKAAAAPRDGAAILDKLTRGLF